MKESKIAQIYLDFRENGMSSTKIIKQLWGLKLLIRILVIIITLFAYFKTGQIALLLCSTFLIGATFDGIGYYIKSAKQWPFTKKVLDWDKIEEIANKEK